MHFKERSLMETIDITELWIRMLEKLKQSLPPQIYNTWIETSLIPYSFENNIFTLDTTTNFICSYITIYTPIGNDGFIRGRSRN